MHLFGALIALIARPLFSTCKERKIHLPEARKFRIPTSQTYFPEQELRLSSTKKRRLYGDALSSFHNIERQNNELDEILEKITDLLNTMSEGEESVKFVQGTLPEAFVGSASKSVKSGMRMK